MSDRRRGLGGGRARQRRWRRYSGAVVSGAYRLTVGEVAAGVQLSRRRLIEVFTAQVGMTPKRLSRVLRFQRANALAQRGGTADWGQLALTCGYFDQSHLIHDVSEFTGTSPVQLGPSSEQVKELHLAVPEGVKFLQDPRRPRA